LLLENGIYPTVVELNMETVRQIREQGINVVYGDATRPETLERAHVGQASTLIMASAGMEHSDAVIRVARQLNPRVYVMARSAYLRDLRKLKSAGADVAFSGEG